MTPLNQQKSNVVKVIKTIKTGLVVNRSSFNPNEGWILVHDFENDRIGFINGEFNHLDSCDLKKMFEKFKVDFPILKPKGFAEGQLLPGRVVTQDRLTPVLKANPDFCVYYPDRVPGSANYSSMIKDACKNVGLVYMLDREVIYRKNFWSPYPEGHPEFETDIFITPDNLDEVNAFIDKLTGKHLIDLVLIPYRTAKKWGYCDKNKNVLIKCIYDNVSWFAGGLAVVKLNRKEGYIDKSGKTIVPCIYDTVNEYFNGFAKVCLNGKYGFIDESGNPIIDCIYDQTKDFNEGLAAVKLNETWGFIDITGKLRIPIEYDEVGSFSDGLVPVKRGYNSLEQRSLSELPDDYDELLEFLNKETVISYPNMGKLCKWGYIDISGTEVIPFVYDEAWNFSDGVACARLGGNYGVIDKAGTEIIPFIYSERSIFTEGYSVKRNGKYGFIDKAGKEVIPLHFDSFCWFSDELARVKLKDKYGFVDRFGKITIQCIYTYADNFSEGLAAVTLTDNSEEGFWIEDEECREYCSTGIIVDQFWGYIDKNGNEIIPFIYNWADSFVNGLACVKLKEKFGCIDKNGIVVIPLIYDDRIDFFEGYAEVELNGTRSYIDNTGKQFQDMIFK